MNIQNRKHMLKWHSWNTNRKLRVLVSMIMIFHETQCLSNWETFPTILKIFSITHKLYHMWLCLKLEAMQSDFLLTTTVTITYLDRNLLASTMFTYPCLKLLQAKYVQRYIKRIGCGRTYPTMFSYRRFNAVNQGLLITNIFTRFKFATVSQNVKNVKIVWFGKGHLLNFK